MGVDVVIRTLEKPSQAEVDALNERLLAAGFDRDWDQMALNPHVDEGEGAYVIQSGRRAYQGDNKRYYHSWPRISEMLLLARAYLPDYTVLYGNDTLDFDAVEMFEPVTVAWMKRMWVQWRKGEGVN